MDQKFVDKAKNELGEDDLKKMQSLQQFREFISKHHYLNEAPQGDTI